MQNSKRRGYLRLRRTEAGTHIKTLKNLQKKLDKPGADVYYIQG